MTPLRLVLRCVVHDDNFDVVVFEVLEGGLKGVGQAEFLVVGRDDDAEIEGVLGDFAEEVRVEVLDLLKDDLGFLPIKD